MAANDVAATPTTADALRRQLLRSAPARPFVTCYDADGGRTELSSSSFDNAVAKAANLLRDELGLGAGALVALRLPLHWWTAVWVGACAAAGAIVCPAAEPDAVDLVVTTLADVDSAAVAPDVVVCRLDPWGRPFDAPLPSGVIDHAAAARAQGDRFDAVPASRDSASPAVRLPGGRLLTNADVVAAARSLGGDVGLGAGGRLLTTADPTDLPGLLAVMAVPAAVQGSVVLCADPARADAVAAVERATARLT